MVESSGSVEKGAKAVEGAVEARRVKRGEEEAEGMVGVQCAATAVFGTLYTGNS